MTRPFPMELTLAASRVTQGSIQFVDEGTAFAEALEKWQSSFGSLCIDCDEIIEFPFSPENLRQLLQLNFYFEKLTLPSIYNVFAECALLPFSAKTNALVYNVDLLGIQPEVLNTLDIVAHDLFVKAFVGDEIEMDDLDVPTRNTPWATLLVSFLDRLADLGHFKRLSLAMETFCRCDIKVNPKLEYLNFLGGAHWAFDWTPYLKEFSEAIVEHQGLRTIVIDHYPEGDTDYSWLKLLLSRNRNITVLDGSGTRSSDGSSIEKLYALNRFYHGSADLMKESSSSLRTNLVATALVKSASENHQHTALLLSNHEDALCELIQNMMGEEHVVSQPVLAETEMFASLSPDTKRVRRS